MELKPSTPPPRAWLIGIDGVGPLLLGRPLPAELLAQVLEARVILRTVADAQPFAGLRFDDPPLMVALPSDAAARREADEEPPSAEARRRQVVAAARAGAPVRAILVHGPGPTTRAGIGVGSRLAALRAAYPDLELDPVPPTLGGDECVAESEALPRLRFLFASCEAAEAGAPVLRIDLWP